jgi:hypothetical protein
MLIEPSKMKWTLDTTFEEYLLRRGLVGYSKGFIASDEKYRKMLEECAVLHPSYSPWKMECWAAYSAFQSFLPLPPPPVEKVRMRDRMVRKLRGKGDTGWRIAVLLMLAAILFKGC